MIESEFDKYVRDLLQNAEEEVSPRVWEGVAAGLAGKRRVVPFWRWAAVSVAAAAAAVVAFVVFHSSPSTISSVNTSAATAQVQETLPVVEAQPVQVSVPVPEQEKPTVRSRVSAIPSAAVAYGQVVHQKAQQLILRAQKAIAPDEHRLSLVEDNRLLNQLAYAQRKPEGDKGFSLVAAGQVQGNQRGQVNTLRGPRPYSAPLLLSEGIYNETPETNFRLPFSIGVGVRYSFNGRWAVGTGLRYTNLGRTFMGDFVSKDGIIVTQTDIDNQQHWLGVPLNLYYDMVNHGRWRVHGFVGGAAEFLVVNDFLVHYSPKDLHYVQRGTTPQWSAGAGLGVEYRVAPRVGIYMDPSFRYYFDAGSQPRSLRTIQPLRFEMEAGLRFTFGNK